MADTLPHKSCDIDSQSLRSSGVEPSIRLFTMTEPPTHKVEFTKILDGLAGAEGPVFDKNGNFYMMAPEVEKDHKPAGQIYKVDLERQKATLLCEPNVNGYGGIPAGCQCDKDGNLYVADMRLGILRVSPAGDCEQLAVVDSEGRTMQGCNDCCFDHLGNLWVTAPAGKIAPHPYERSMEEPFGSVYCVTREGQVIRADTGLRFPNGIYVSPDGTELTVAETPTKTLWKYTVTGPGQLCHKNKWTVLTRENPHNGGPDGMAMDASATLLAAHWGAGTIDLVSRDGQTPFRSIACPFQKPSNLCFQPGATTVYVTEHDSHGLWKFEWCQAGTPQYCDVN